MVPKPTARLSMRSPSAALLFRWLSSTGAGRCSVTSTLSSAGDFEVSEASLGRIQPGSAVALPAGWSAVRGDPGAYLGRGGDGPLKSLGRGRGSATLVDRTPSAAGLGANTFSIDRGTDGSGEVHSAVTSSRGVWHLEGFTDIERVPARRAAASVGVIPPGGGTEAPFRVLAVVPDRDEHRPSGGVS